jgi:ubiquinone/menaquinone biosynthesis C-methylase UbiE
MRNNEWLKDILRSPETGEPLSWNGDSCSDGKGKTYHSIDCILSFIDSSTLSGQDAAWNKFYNLFAPLYDFNERVMGKLLVGVDMVAGRMEIVSRLNLKLGMRLLEISPGPGVFQRLLRKTIGADAEYAALDLSIAMLRQCKLKNSDLNIELIHADAQSLPFAENSFDAVFHFGGVNLFNDPGKAIDEFIRVAKADGIVSWGDEGFSEKYPDNLRRKILSKMNPGYTKIRQPVPSTVYSAMEHEVYDGLGYLVVGRKSG